MESPRKREVFAEKEQTQVQVENIEMLRKRLAEEVAEHPHERRDEPSSKSRRKSAKPTK